MEELSPVPWVANWSAELTVHPEPVRDRKGRIIGGPGIAFVGGRPWICPDGRGEGEPAFASMSSHRQARCMVEGLCQVCGLPLPADVGIFLLSGSTVDEWVDEGVTSVPPVCPACEVRASNLCPHLRDADQFRIAGRFRPKVWLAHEPSGRTVVLPWSTASKKYLGRMVGVEIHEEVEAWPS